MQFHLEKDELNLLANFLLEEDPEKYGEIFDKVMAGNLRFDAAELEDTAELLTARKTRLNQEIARQTDPARVADLQKKLAVLEHTLERVTEACIMF